MEDIENYSIEVPFSEEFKKSAKETNEQDHRTERIKKGQRKSKNQQLL